MRVLIIGNLAGQLSAATKMAFDKGAKVLHANDVGAAMDLLRTGRGADIVMIDVHEDIQSLVGRPGRARDSRRRARIHPPAPRSGINRGGAGGGGG
jgi:hypothetical protein